MGKDVTKVLDNLRRQCSRREYCVSDVMKKARKALEGDEAQVREVVDKLLKDKYVDDSRYAAAYAREKSSVSGWGDVKIRYMLSSKGISGDVIPHSNIMKCDMIQSGMFLHASSQFELLAERTELHIPGKTRIKYMFRCEFSNHLNL